LTEKPSRWPGGSEQAIRPSDEVEKAVLFLAFDATYMTEA